MGAQTLGVVHPPGYPLFTILGYISSQVLSFLDPAMQIHAINALYGALASGVLALLIDRLMSHKPAAYFGAFTAAFTPITWSLSATTEIYSLNMLFISLVWLSLCQFRVDGRAKTLYLFCALLGLACSNSYPLVMLSAVGMLFWFPWRNLTWRRVGWGLLAFISGLTPYLYLVIQSQRLTQIPYVFFNLDGWSQILPYILRTNYAGLDHKTANLEQKWEVLQLLGKYLVTDFTLTSVWVVIGVFFAFRSKQYWRWPIVIATFASSILLFALLGTKPEGDSFALFYDYTLPTMAYLAIFAAFGFHIVLKRWPQFNNQIIVAAACCLLVQGSMAFPKASHHDNTSVESWGTAFLNSLPPNANLVFCGDEGFALQYLQLIKGVRPDLLLYSTFNGQGTRYLFVRGPKIMDSLHLGITFKDIRERSKRPSFITISDCNGPYNLDNQQVVLKGFAYQIIDRPDEELPGMDVSADQVEALLDLIMNTYPRQDHWINDMRTRTLKTIFAYGLMQKKFTTAQVDQWLIKYGVDKNPDVLAGLAAELAYARNFDTALIYYQRIPRDQIATVNVVDVDRLCRFFSAFPQVTDIQPFCQNVIDYVRP